MPGEDDERSFGLRRREVIAALTAATTTSTAGCSISINGETILTPGDDADGGDGGDSDGGVEGQPQTLTGDAAAAELSALETGPKIDHVEATDVGDGYHQYIMVMENGDERQLNDDVRMQEINEQAPDLGDRSAPYHGPNDVFGGDSEGADTANDLSDMSLDRSGTGDSEFDAVDSLASDALNADGSRPAAVSHKQWQTPLKNQMSRFTCVDFCTLAAMEARIKRQTNQTVDLSEQYANHIEKMVDLQKKPRTDEYIENGLGAQGGGGSKWNLAVYSQFGVPARADDEAPKYVNSRDFGQPNQQGDDPRYDWKDATSLSQQAADDFNLADETITVQVPWDLPITPFPQVALEGAKYNIGKYHTAAASDLDDPSYYESALADGYEVVIDYKPGCVQTDDNGVLQPRNNCTGGGHCVLLVGYDRTGDNEYFAVKDSYDNWAKMGYDVIREGHILQAGYMENVFIHDGSYVKPDLFLGRWDLTLDGSDMTLDIYHLPRFFDTAPHSLESDRDKRLGALFDENGNMYRVNGRLAPIDAMNGNVDYNGEWAALLFSVDFENPHQGYGVLPNDGTITTHGIMYLHPDDASFAAGQFLPQPPRTGGHKGFYATKDDATPEGYAPFGSFRRSALYGYYKIRSPVVSGKLLISELDGTDLTAEYIDVGGNSHEFTGRLDSPEGGENAQHVELPLPTVAGGGTFDGWVHSDDPSKISGHYTQNGTRTGMLFVRQASQSVDIVSPADGDEVDTTFIVKAQVVGATGDPLVIWTSRGKYAEDDMERTIIGRGTEAKVKLPAGEHTIYANYSPPEHDGFVTDHITVTASR